MEALVGYINWYFT